MAVGCYMLFHLCRSRNGLNLILAPDDFWFAVRRKAYCKHRGSIFSELIVVFLYYCQSGDSIYAEGVRLFTFLHSKIQN